MRLPLAVLALCALIALPASASTYNVNSPGDSPDLVPGDDACDAGLTFCTLRAAIMESNAHAGTDTINVPLTGTITPASLLPPLTEPVNIVGNALPGMPLITLDGSGTLAVGLDFAAGADASQLSKFEVRNFTDTNVSIAADGVQLTLNFLGTLSGGSSGTGVRVTSTAAGTEIGSPFFENVISGNGIGVEVIGASSTLIQANRIGVDWAGTTAVPNGVGIVVTNASFTTIGGHPAVFNIISGNSVDGVRLDGSTNTLVGGNLIGTDATGLLPVPNGDLGIRANGTDDTIGNATLRNVISGNTGAGILLTGTQTTLNNNFIGLGADGLITIPNQWGIVEMGTGSAIGGASLTPNVISGNLLDGMLVNPSSVNARIRNNYIGTDAFAAGPDPNGQNGIRGDDATGVIIGGSLPGEGNIISGNKVEGIAGGFSNTTIAGNRIGLNILGLGAVPNGENGIELSTGSGVTIGRGNTISGNTENGIALNGSVTGVIIDGNFIGTVIDGGGSLGNTLSGIELLNVSGVDITDNIISGNFQAGVDFRGTTNDVEVYRNIIGRGPTSAGALPNMQEGLRIRDLSSGITVGGVLDGNIIASNIAPFGGILVTPTATALIRANSIFDNGGLGIDLHGDGVTPNDAGDGDTGGNALQNFPDVTSVVSDATESYIAGTLNSTPSTTFPLDFFTNATPDPSGFGEGQTYIGTLTVTTDATGNVPFLFIGPPLAAGTIVTATATAATGTSEFAENMAAAPLATIQFSSATYAAAEGDGSATITVTRSGDLTAISSIQYATSDGTANDGTDYTGASGTLTFLPGEDTLTFNVPILDDTIDETDETVTLTLSNPTIALLGAPATATLTITDDDPAPSISIDDVSLNEETGTFTFTLTLSNPSASVVAVSYATADGTATAGSDYTAATDTLTFAPGDTSETFTVTVLADTNSEADEMFFVNLSGATNATIGDAQGVGTIVNDDAAAAAEAIPTLSETLLMALCALLAAAAWWKVQV